MSSAVSGRMGFFSSAASAASTNAWSIPASLLDDERKDETEQGECLYERDAEEHRGPDHAGGLGLASHGLDGLADEEADADAGADGGEPVDQTLADGADVAVDRGEQTQVRHVLFPPPSARGGWPRRCRRP